MGTLTYGSAEHVCTIDDRALAHLQVVIIDRLRRGEHFAFTCDDGTGPTTLWMSPHIPLQFCFHEPADATINREWVTALEQTARTAWGLHLVDEPTGVDQTPTAPREHVTEADIAGQQLQDALSDRTLIEQAKGILAETGQVGMDEALRRLTQRARSTRRTLPVVAQEIIDSTGSR